MADLFLNWCTDQRTHLKKELARMGGVTLGEYDASGKLIDRTQDEIADCRMRIATVDLVIEEFKRWNGQAR